ncbi:unnamed protein product [Brassica oleracea]
MISEGLTIEVNMKHEKQLGNIEQSRIFFVDGCGKDGKQIYVPFKGSHCQKKIRSN